MIQFFGKRKDPCSDSWVDKDGAFWTMNCGPRIEVLVKKESHCPSCGYTKKDAQFHGDHSRCKNAGNAPWEKSSAQAKIPQPPSQGEETFALHCKINGLTPEREFIFAPPRRWRIDFAWPELKIAVEVESSVHRIKNRFAGDLEKYNELTKRGWRLFRYTRKMIETGAPILEVMEALGLEG